MERITIEEMQNVVSAYIREKKGITVKIDIQAHARKSGIFAALILQEQLDKLHAAYNVANHYFTTKA